MEIGQIMSIERHNSTELRVHRLCHVGKSEESECGRIKC